MSKVNNRQTSNVDQKAIRKKTFTVDHYWCISYSEVYQTGEEWDFKTIIKARSAALAKDILQQRLQENSDFKRLRSITISLIHSKWNVRAFNKPLSVTQWGAIRAVAFPNDRNKVFKFEKPRLKEQYNRFNTRKTHFTPERREALRQQVIQLNKAFIKDTFKPLCPDLSKECLYPAYCKKTKIRKGYASYNNEDQKNRELAYLRKLMKDCGGNIQYAADTAGVGRSSLYRSLNRFRNDVDWRKEYPLTYTRPSANSMASPEARANLSRALKKSGHKPPPNNKGTPQYKKWKKSITATFQKRGAKALAEWKSKLIHAMRENDCRREDTAVALGISVGYMNSLLLKLSKEDPSFKKEFYCPTLAKKLRRDSFHRTKEAKLAKFIKENKHIIMQSYYQNEKSDRKAAASFKVCGPTFRKWREKIQENA